MIILTSYPKLRAYQSPDGHAVAFFRSILSGVALRNNGPSTAW